MHAVGTNISCNLIGTLETDKSSKCSGLYGELVTCAPYFVYRMHKYEFCLKTTPIQ